MKGVRKAWQFPWGFRESLFIAVALYVTGSFIQIFSKSFAPLPQFPNNLIILISYIVFIVVVRLLFVKNPIVQWLSTVPAAVGSVTVFGVLSLMMGLIPQSPVALPEDLFHNITNSWAYFLALLYILTVLGFTVMKRILPFTLKNIWFQFNHLGLWIVIAGAAFGAGDIRRLKMETRLNEPVWIAIDDFGNQIEPGLAVELQNFSIEFYSPAITLYDFKTEKPVKKAKPYLADSVGQKIKIGDWNVTVDSLFKSAMWVGGTFRRFNGPGAVPAAYIRVSGSSGEISGWINPGNKLNPSQAIMIDNNTGLILQFPRPEKYVSEIKIYSKSDSIYNATIEVNSPFYAEGWRIYQLSFNEELGEWSDISIIELNRDPWLPVVYIGLFMMIIGAIYLFYAGMKKKGEMK